MFNKVHYVKSPKKIFNIPVSMAKRATQVNTLAAVKVFPNRTYVTNVRTEITTGVVAHKYTHKASKYFLKFKN